MSRPTFLILAIAFVLLGTLTFPNSAVAGDRTVWKATDGMTIRQEGGNLWRAYRADASEGMRLVEVERTAAYVLLYDEVTQKHLRLESGQLLVAGRLPRDFRKTMVGDWVRTGSPVSQGPVSSVWIMEGGRAGYMREDANTWREYSTTGEPASRFTEQERGDTWVVIHNPARELTLKLEPGRCLIRMSGMREFVSQWNGNWALAAPRHWQTPGTQAGVASVWVMQGGRAGFRLEGGRTWKEYGAGGRPLNTFTEMERSNSHVLLHDTARGAYLRLEAGRCFIKLPNQRDFSPQWYGDWSESSPAHWQGSAPRTMVTSVWLIKGGLAGYRQEAGGAEWREYSTGGRPLALFTEQERGSSHVLLHDATRGISVRLETGRSYLKSRGRNQFAAQWEGDWAAAAPAHWGGTEPQDAEIWLFASGGGYRREGSPPAWVAYGPDGRVASRFLEESRTAAYVQILEPTQALRMRLLAGELQVQEAGTGRFVRQAHGNWAARAPSNWPALPTTAPRRTSVWVYDRGVVHLSGGGFHHVGDSRWVEYDRDGSWKQELRESLRTDDYVLLIGRARVGRDTTVCILDDRCLVSGQGAGGSTEISPGHWAASVPNHWRTGDPLPGAGGTTAGNTVWRGTNEDFFRNESGRWMHYQGRTRNLLLEYEETSRTSQYVELWNRTRNDGVRLYPDRCETWNRSQRRWLRSQAGAWAQESPPEPAHPIRRPKTQTFPLHTESVNCTPIGSQTPFVLLRVARAVGQARDGSRYAHMSLDKSTITAARGALTEDRDDQRGFYLESVQVTIEPVDNILSLHSDGPGPFAGKGELQSVSGLNLFSGQPVSPVLPENQIGRRNDFGMRHSETYVDFHVESGTRARRVDHTYRLATVVAPGNTWDRNGGSVLYRTWEDLASKSLGRSELCTLPPRAVKGFPLISQATFQAPGNFTGVASIKLTLQLTFRYVKAEGRFLNMNVKDRSQGDAVTRIFEFDFGGL